MIIIGIDPGTRLCGFAIINISKSNIKVIKMGTWNLIKYKSLTARLGQLNIEFNKICQEYKPQKLCIETVFVAYNSKSALTLGAARGVILSEAYKLKIETNEISATSVKKYIGNYGRTKKEFLAKILCKLLKIQESEISSYDATDALAIAYSYISKINPKELNN